MHPKHTKDLSDEFFIGLDEMCTRLGAPKAAMLGVMMSESGVSASKRNPGSSATGLIQSMAQKDGRYFGMTRDQFGASLRRGPLPPVCGEVDYSRGYLPSGLSSGADRPGGRPRCGGCGQRWAIRVGVCGELVLRL